MESIEKALVLKVGRFKEVDAWVRLFSSRRGVFNAFAFGASVSRRRFLGCLDPFNLVEFKIKTDTAKGYTYLLEGSLVASHPNLRRDQDRLGMAVNCLKFVEAAHLGPSGSEGAFSLLLETLAVMDTQEHPSRLLPLFFRSRLAFDQGFKPDLTACARCGADLSQVRMARFLVEQGKFHCSDCLRFTKGVWVDMGRNSLEALTELCSKSPDEWGGGDVSAQVRMECGRALDMFVEYHLGLTWDHGSFRRI